MWGNATAVKATQRNLVNMRKLGSILADNSSLILPNTIREALRFYPRVGVRYLWVDSLCIVQDEEDTKQLYLNSMASIYTNAYFTIVAADGENANYGLRGIKGITQARNIVIDVVRLPSDRETMIY